MLMQTVVRSGVLLAVSAALVACGGGGGDSSSPAPSVTPPSVTTPPVVTDLERPDISVADDSISSSSYAGFTYTPLVDRQKGSLSFTAEPAGIVEDNGNGQLRVIKPGSATVTVVDTAAGYVTKQDTFRLTVEKWENRSLTALPLQLTTLGESKTAALVPRGAKGLLGYRVKNGSENYIRVDDEGRVTAMGTAGTAFVTITDSGNDAYKASSIDVEVDIESVAADELKYRTFEETYAPGLTLQAEKLSGSELQSQTYSVRDNQQDAITIDQNTGLILVKRAGEATVDVNVLYQKGYNREREQTSFKITIAKAKAPEYLRSTSKTVTYVDGGSLTPEFAIKPDDVTYKLTSGQDQIALDRYTGEPRMVNAGTAVLTVAVPESDRYKAYEQSVTFTINPAPHPGLKNISRPLTFEPQLKTPLSHPEQLGTLTVSELPQGIELSQGSILVKKAGTFVLKISDDGGRNYLGSSPATLTLNVEPGTMAPLPHLPAITRKYEDDLKIDLTTYYKDVANLGDTDSLEVVSISDTAVVSKGAEPGVININKNGSSVVRVRKVVPENYKPTEDKDIEVTITQVETRLKPAKSYFHYSWQNQKTEPAPEISGNKGALTYSLAEGANTDVIELHEDGSMTLLHPGETKVKVVDEGRDGFAPSATSYEVIVQEAENTATVTYPTVTYAPDRIITPTISIEGMEVVKCFLYSAVGAPVEIKDSDTCSVRVRNAGEYTMGLNLKSRDYREAFVKVKGTINKAPYPGDDSSVRVHFVPRKEFQPDYGAAYGARSFSVDPKDPVKVNSASGAFIVTDYEWNMDDFFITVSETESERYLAGTKRVRVYVLAPEKDKADQTFLVNSKNFDLDSSLMAYQSSALQESKFGVTGVRGLYQGTDKDVEQYGIGVRLVVQMTEKNSGAKKTAQFYLTRNDGCLVGGYLRPKAVDFDAAGYCSENATYRGNRFISMPENDDILTPGEWQSEGPIIIYRYGDRLFVKDTNGGQYVPDDGVLYKNSSTTYEWAVGVIKLSI